MMLEILASLRVQVHPDNHSIEVSPTSRSHYWNMNLDRLKLLKNWRADSESL